MKEDIEYGPEGPSTTSSESIVCPACGHEHRDPWDWFEANQDVSVCECDNCGTTISVSRYVEVTYTAVLEEGGT